MQRFVLWLIYCVIMRWFLRLVIGVKFTLADFLLEEKQFIIVANHNSHLDTMTLLASLPAPILHKVKPVAAEDYFGNTPIKRTVSNFFINTLLISRKGSSGINKMKEALNDGHSLILFPEGSRGEPDEEQSLKPGIGLLLSQYPHIKYVPAYLTNMGKAMPKGDNLILPHESSLVYGQPAFVQSENVRDIVLQIEADMKSLKKS